MWPVAYVAFESATHAPDCTASSTYETFAAAKTSNGAPSATCFSSRPVDPNEKSTLCPVFLSYAAPRSLNAKDRSDAAATRRGWTADGSLLWHAPRASIAPAASAARRSASVLVDDRADIL